MLLTFSAIFTPNNENGACNVSFPDLQHECDITASNNQQLMKEAADELGFALFLREDAGQRLPLPKTISDKELPEDSYIALVPIDYDNFKKFVSVKVIDLSD